MSWSAWSKKKRKSLATSSMLMMPCWNFMSPSIRVEKLDHLFQGVTNELVPLSKGLDPQWKAKPGFLSLKYDKDSQWKFGLEVLKVWAMILKPGPTGYFIPSFYHQFWHRRCGVTTRIDERDFFQTWPGLYSWWGGHAFIRAGCKGIWTALQ